MDKLRHKVVSIEQLVQLIRGGHTDFYLSNGFTVPTVLILQAPLQDTLKRIDSGDLLYMDQ